MEDKEIVDLFWVHSEKAVYETDVKYGMYFRGIACNILHSIEEDEKCVNDAYLEAWNCIPENRPLYLNAFIGRIVRKFSLNRYWERNAGNNTEGMVPLVLEELRECIPESNSPVKAVHEKQEIQLVNTFLYKLSKRDCDVFLRRYWHMESIHKISSYYEMSEDKIKSILFRVRKRLKKYLQKIPYVIKEKEFLMLIGEVEDELIARTEEKKIRSEYYYLWLLEAAVLILFLLLKLFLK